MLRSEVGLIIFGLFWLQLTVVALTLLTDDVRRFVFMPGACNNNDAKGMLNVIVGLFTAAAFCILAIYSAAKGI